MTCSAGILPCRALRKTIEGPDAGLGQIGVDLRRAVDPIRTLLTCRILSVSLASCLARAAGSRRRQGAIALGRSSTAGTPYGPDRRPDSLSRIAILRWNRVARPSEPSRGFCQTVPLELDLLDLATQAPQLGSLRGGRAVSAQALVPIQRGRLEVKELAGKLTLLSPPSEAIPWMAANLADVEVDPDGVVLTGGMAIWAYLAVFHHLHAPSGFGTKTDAACGCWWPPTAKGGSVLLWGRGPVAHVAGIAVFAAGDRRRRRRST